MLRPLASWLRLPRILVELRLQGHRMRLLALTAPLGAALLFGSKPAGGALPLCVQVINPSGKGSALQRLVESELARHRSHRQVKEDCQARLTVEIIEVAGEQVLTARVDGEVPYRTTFKAGGLVRAIEIALKVVLHNDPRILRGPRESGWFSERLREFRIEGDNYYGVEFAQTFALVDSRLQSLAGAAITARREAGSFYLGARVAGASSFSKPAGELRLTGQFLAQIELGAYSNTTESLAYFATLSAGFELQRFQGYSAWEEEPPLASANGKGLSAGIGGGVETLRLHDMRAQLRAQLILPGFISRDIDQGIIDQWVPTAAVSLSVAF